MANESMISLNVSLGSTKNVEAKLNELITKLETKKIKLEIDTGSMKASLDAAVKGLSGVYETASNQAKKAKEEADGLAKSLNFLYKPSLIEGFNFDKFTSAFKQVKGEALELQSIVTNYGKKKNGNGAGALDSVMLQYTNNLGKTVIETMAWAEKFDKAGNSIGMQWQNISTKILSNEQALKQLQSGTDNVVSNMKTKLEKITIGKEFVKDLPAFKTLQDTINNFNPKNLVELAQQGKDVSSMMKQLNLEVDKVKVGDKISSEYTRAQKALESFKASMSNKIGNIEVGKNGELANQLQVFEQLKTKFTELQNFKLTTTNMQDYIGLIQEVNSLYSQTTTKIKEVNATSSQMTSSNKIDEALTNKVRDYNTQLETMKQKNADIINNPLYQQILRDVTALSQAKQPLTQLSNETNTINNNMKKLNATMSQTANASGIFAKLGQSIKSAFSFMSASMIFYQIANQVRSMPRDIIKLDTALVDLRKTTSMTTDELNEFYKTSNEMAKSLGVTTEEIINQASAWSRLGYSTKEQAETMAEVSAIFKSISPDMSMDEATDGLVSSMKAFKIEASEALDGVASKINAVGNTQAVNNKDIVEFLTRSSSAMAEANNTLDQSIALGTAMTEITRDAASTGQILKTTSMRIRGYSEETEAYTEDVEVLSGKIADLTKTASTPGGISLFTDETKETYKSTYSLLEDISKIYDQLTDKDQAQLLEVLAGKRNGQGVAALLSNFSAATSSLETMANSQGGAMKEMEIIYDSLEYKINRLKETWIGLAQGFIERDAFKGFIDSLTGLLEFIDNMGGLMPILTGVIVSMTALKVISASQSLTFSGLAQGAKTLVGSLFTVKTATDATTASTIALGTAQKLLIGGGIVAGVMAIAYGVNYLTTSAERAEKKIVGLRDEISELKTNNQNVSDLANRYDELSTAAELSAEEQQELVDVQNKLKEQLPEISGYYDSSGNFIATNTEQIRENIKATDDLINKRKELLSEKQASRVGFTIDDINQYTVLSEEIDQYIKLKEKLAKDGINSVYSTNEDLLGVGFSQEDIDLLNRLDVVYGSVENAQSDLANSTKDTADSIAKLRQEYSDLITSSDSYKNLTPDQQNQINESIKTMSVDELKSIEDDITNSTEEYVNKFDFSMTKTIDIAKNAEQEVSKSFKEMIDDIENSTSSMDILSVAISELKNKGVPTSETLEELSKQYPKIFDGCITAADGIKALNKQLVVNELNKATDDISSLSSVLSDLEENNQLTSSSFETLANNFPDLLGYMDDEVALSAEITKKMDELKQTQNRAYSDMLADSEEYYAQKINKDGEWVTSTQNNLNQLLSSLGVGYEVDLKNYTSLEEAKIGVTNSIVKQLGNIWADYFGMIADGMSLGDIESSMYINGDESLGTNMNYEAYNQAKKIHDVFENLSNSFASVGDKFNSGTKSSSSSKDSTSSYIKSLYQSMVDSILSGGDDVTKAISLTNAKIENAQLLGDLDLEQEQTNKLADLFKQERDNQATMAKELDVQLNSMRKDLANTGMFKGIDLSTLDNLELDKVVNSIDKKLQSATGNEKTRLEGLKSIIEDVGDVYLSTLEQREELSTTWWEKENQRRQQEIDNIKRLSEIDKQRYDDKLKQIELEQMYMTEDSDEYAAKEQEKINLLIELQKGYQDTISQLKAQGKSEDQADVREYINLYTDAEIEILNVKKAMAEKERTLQIKASQDMVTALEKQKDAIEERTELVMDMIKKEQELRKKAIDEEIDGYEKIIEARKKTITDEQDENDYNEELSEKQKVVTALENKLLTMQDDNSESSKAQRLKLEEELAKARKDVNKFQLDKITDDRLNALDEELNAFKDEKQEELAEIEDYLSKEGQIRTDAMKRIEQEGKSMYDSLKKYNSEYGSLAESELMELWTTATTSVNGYIDSNKSLLEIMKDITAEINKQTNLQKTLGTDNWQTFAPSTSTSTTTSSNKNLDVITKMMENSNKWKSASKEEQVKLAEENQKLGNKIGAVYDKYSGVWYTDSTKRKKLFDISQYHSGGIVGNMKLKSNEEFAKLLKGEVVVNSSQIENFMNKTLPSITKNVGSGAEINLNIGKLIDVDKLDNTIDIESVVSRAVNQMMKTLNTQLGSIGVRCSPR